MQGEIRRVAGHSATYAVGVVAGGLGRVFLIPIVARFLTADEYGVVALVLAMVSLVGILMDMGFSTSLIKFFSEAPDRAARNRVVSTTLLGGLASGVLISLLLSPAGSVLSAVLFGRSDYVRFIHLGLGLALASTLLRVMLSYYQAVPAPRTFAAVSVVKGGLAVGGAALFVIYLGWGPAGFLVGSILPPALLAAMLIPALLHRVGLAFERETLRKSLRFGVPLVPSTFAMWGLTYCDIYLLGRLASLHDVGWYQLGQEICLGMGLVVSAVQLAWPRFIFSHARDAGAPRVFALFTNYYALALGFAGLFLSVFAGEIVRVIGSEAYLPAASVIPILCLATLLFALYGVFASGVQIAGRTEYMALTTGGGLVLNVVLNLLLIPRYGMIGAASASAFCNVILCAVILRISKRFYPIPFSAVRLGGTIALAAGLFLLSLGTGRLPGPAWVLSAKAGIVAALPVVGAFGFLSSEERGRVGELVRDLYRRGA